MGFSTKKTNINTVGDLNGECISSDMAHVQTCGNWYNIGKLYINLVKELRFFPELELSDRGSVFITDDKYPHELHLEIEVGQAAIDLW